MFKFRMYFFNSAILLLVIYDNLVYATECTAIPVSLSDLQLCKNNVCTYTQTANVAIPTFAGSSACVQFVTTDGLGSSTTLNITMDHANFVFGFDYSYPADDPASQLNGYCGCPGGNSVSCSATQVPLIYRQLVFCKDGLHKNNYCPVTNIFGTPGTYVAKLGLEGNPRFKIMKISPVSTLDIGVVAVSSTTAWAMEYSGVVISSTDNPQFNITVISDTIKNPYNVDFVVFDKTSQTDFWLMDDSEVNALNEYNTQKIGAFKSFTNGSLVTGNQLFSDVSVSITDCKNNKFTSNANWLNNANYLINAVNKLSNNIMPESYLQDTEWNPRQPLVKSTPQLLNDPYEYLKDGWMIYTGSEIIFFGVNEDDMIIPMPSTVGGQGLPTPFLSTMVSWNNTQCTVGTVTIMDGTSCEIAKTDLMQGQTSIIMDVSTGYPTILVTWVYMHDYNLHGFCEYVVPSGNMYCGVNVDISFVAMAWPAMRIATFTYLDTFEIEYDDIPPQGPSQLIVPATNGVLNVQIQFTNFTITFLQTVIRPKINSIRYENPNIFVTIQSTSVPGTCLTASTPAGTIVTQSVMLAVSPQEFALNIAVESYYGEVGITVQCYEFQASTEVFVDYNYTYYTQNGNNITAGEYFEPGKWTGIYKDSSNKFLTILKLIGVILGSLAAVIFIAFMFKYIAKIATARTQSKTMSTARKYEMMTRTPKIY